jgi:hypothetical protein
MIAPAIAFALVLGAFIFFILPRERQWQRVASIGLYVVLLATVYIGSTELMGRPKPMRVEWRHASEAKMIAATMKENEGIYLWLDVGQAEPRAYALPWSQEMAQQLQRAMSDAQQNGTEVKMVMPFDGGGGLDDRAPKFYAMPQPAMPEKDYGSTTLDGPIIVQQ